MPHKEEILDSLDKPSYSLKEVRHLVGSVKTAANVHAPEKLKAGDVFTADWGLKRRPLVVIAVREKIGLVISVPLTTTENELAMMPYKSRIMGEGFFSNQLVTAKIQDVKDNFVGVLENRQAIRNAKKLLKQFYKGIL